MELQVFCMSYTTDKKQIGDDYPQANIEFYDGKDSWDINYDSNLKEYVEFGKLRKGNIFSDFLSTAEFAINKAFILKERVFLLLSKAKMPEIRTYAINILKGGSKEEYVLSMLKFDTVRYVKFEDSLFCEDFFYKKIGPIAVTDYDDYRAKSSEAATKGGGIFSPVKLTVDKAILEHYDVFSFPGVTPKVYATSRFKSLIEEMKITGLQFSEAAEIEII